MWVLWKSSVLIAGLSLQAVSEGVKLLLRSNVSDNGTDNFSTILCGLALTHGKYPGPGRKLLERCQSHFSPVNNEFKSLKSKGRLEFKVKHVICCTELPSFLRRDLRHSVHAVGSGPLASESNRLSWNPSIAIHHQTGRPHLICIIY